MPTSLRFADHEGFHRHALAMTTLGAGAGLLTDLAVRFQAHVLVPGSLAFVAGVVVWAAALPARRTQLGVLGALFATMALATAGLGMTMNSQPPLALLALYVLPLGAVLGHLVAPRGLARPVAWATGAATVAAACAVALRVGTHALVPAGASATFSGAAFGLTASMSLLLRHVSLARDPIAEAWDELRGDLSGEPRELLTRALQLWGRLRDTLPPGESTRAALEESLLGMMAVARRWQAIEAEGTGASLEGLLDRLAKVEEKLAQVDDPIARRQYEHTKEALGAQLASVKEIATSRERIVARMHHTLAAMERLRLAVLNHRSVDASRVSAEVGPLLDDLKDLGQELDLTSQAIGQVEADA